MKPARNNFRWRTWRWVFSPVCLVALLAQPLAAQSAEPADTATADQPGSPRPPVPAPEARPPAAISQSGPQCHENDVRSVIDTNPPPVAPGGTNTAPGQEKFLKWEFSWRGWDGLHLEVVERTPLTNNLGYLHLEKVKLSGTFGARLEVDGAAFLTSDNLTGFNDNIQLRRLRFLADGDCILVLPASYDIELGYSGGQFTLNQSDLLFKNIGLIGNLWIGQFQTPMGLVLITSSRDITFMEPAAPIEALAPGVEAGIEIGRPIFNQRATWAFGLFAPGAGSSEYGNGSKNYGNAGGRVTWLPLYHPDPDHPAANRLLHLGLSANELYSSTSTVRYQSRPESYIAPYVVDTGNINANNATTVGAEAAWVNGPYCLQGEFIQSFVSEKSGGTAYFWGFYASASRYLTGETRPYDPAAGDFARLIPRHNYNFGKGGLGAIELAYSFSYTDLTDGGVRGGRLSLIMGGVNWYLTPHVKWMFNCGPGHESDGPQDGNLFIFQTRIGVDF